ncbi:MAG: endo-1,4-beta-xylanase [Oscillospiraceae bacterium]|nr:endo-1,4-beta-xylanase [Oscillospiraceae bacterium]
MKKRIFSLFLTVSLILVPFTALAETPLMQTIDFEDGTRNGFTGNAPNVRLAVSTVQARSGNRSLLTTGRELKQDGPSLHIEQYVEPEVVYTVSAWVRLRTPASAEVSLMTQAAGTTRRVIDTKTAVRTGWVLLTGRVSYSVEDVISEQITIYIQSADETAEFYIDDVSLVPFVDTTLELELALQASELPALNKFYSDHFPLGVIAEAENPEELQAFQHHFGTVESENNIKSVGVTGENDFDYIYDTFVSARLENLEKKLYYIDESFYDLTKVRSAIIIIREINARWANDPRNIVPDRLLVEGVSNQSHFNTKTDLYNVEEALKLFITTGVYVDITELDVSIAASATPTSLNTVPAPIDFHEQAEMYANLMQLYKKYSDYISRVSFNALPFNGDLTPNLAYFAIADPEGYLAGNFDTLEKVNAWLEASTIPDEPFTEDDALIILKSEVGLLTLTAWQKRIYDLNGDGVIDSDDALIILKMIVGLI